jgi:hypothetical protein
MARSLHTLAEAVVKIVDEEYADPEPEEALPLTKVAWKAEVAKDNTVLGFPEWLKDRRDLETRDV